MAATTVSASPRPARVSAALRRLGGAPGLVVVLIVLVELGLLFVILRNGGWTFDDNLSLELARANGLSWHWLTSSLFGHFEIAHRAVSSIQLHLMPVDYRWALAAMLALLAASAWLLSQIGSILRIRPWSRVAMVGYFGISILLVAPLQWWATGLEAFPTIFLKLLQEPWVVSPAWE